MLQSNVCRYHCRPTCSTTQYMFPRHHGVKTENEWSMDHFTRVSAVDAQCNLCAAKIGYKGGGTSAMLLHLSGKHNINVKDRNSSEPKVPQKPTTSRPIGSQGPIPITSFLQRPMSAEKQQSVTHKALLMCIEDLRPLSIVEGKGFRQFCKALNPSYRCPSHTTMHNYLHLRYCEQKEILIDCLSKLDSLALTSHH